MNHGDRIIQSIVRSGLFLTAFVPLLIFQKTFSPFFFGKDIILRLLVELLLSFYIWLALRHPQFRPSRSLVVVLVWVFVISAVISGLVGVDRWLSFFGTWERMGGVLALTHYAVLITMLAGMFRSREDWRPILGLSIAVAVVSTCYGFLQTLHLGGIVGATGRFRILGTIGNPAALAGYLLLNIFFALSLMRHASSRLRLVGGFMVAILTTGIVFTAVRGAVLGLIVGFIFLGWEQRRAIAIIFRGYRYVSTVIIFMVLLVGILGSRTSYGQRLIRVEAYRETIDQRFIVWQIGLHGIAERPLLGWGPENFPSIYSRWFDSRLFTDANGIIFDRAHDVLVDIATSQGLVGLVIWCALIFFVCRRLRGALRAGMVAYVVYLLFFFELPPTMLMAGYLIAYAATEREGYVPLGGAVARKWVFIATTVTSIVCIGGWALHIRSFAANSAMANSFNAFNQGDGLAGDAWAKKALANESLFLSDVRRKYAEGLVGWLFNVSASEQVEHTSSLDAVIDVVNRELDHDPGDYASWLYLYKACRARELLFARPDIPPCTSTILLDGLAHLPNALPLRDELYNADMEHRRFAGAIADMTMVRAAVERSTSETRFLLGVAIVSQALVVGTDVAPGMGEVTGAIQDGYRQPDAILELAGVLERSHHFTAELQLFSSLEQYDHRYLIHMAYTEFLLGQRTRAHQLADQALALSRDELTPEGFRYLSDLYALLGDNAKRSQAFMKSVHE